MKDEAKIVKILREEEKLGRLYNKSHSGYEIVELPKKSKEELTEDISHIFGNNGVKKTSNTELGCIKEKFRDIFDATSDFLLYLNPEGIILDINSTAVKVGGLEKEKLIGKSFSKIKSIFSKEDMKKYLEAIDNATQGVKIGDYEINLITKDGIQKSIADSAAPIRDRESMIIGVVLVFRDITNERKMEEELLKIKKLESVGILAGGIAHDFNNLLQIMLGHGDLLLLDRHENDPGYEEVQAIRQGARRGAELVKQILILSFFTMMVTALTAILN